MEIETSLDEELTPLKYPDEIQAWLIEKFAAELWLEPAEVDVRKNFRAFGMDSISASVLIGEIAERMQFDAEPSLFERFSTIEALTLFLAERAAEANETA